MRGRLAARRPPARRDVTSIRLIRHDRTVPTNTDIRPAVRALAGACEAAGDLTSGSASPYVICLDDAARAELEAVYRRATAPFRLVQRARIVLLAAGRLENRVIAERLGICEDIARKWRRGYCQGGLAEQILAFEQHYNATGRPFDWKFTRAGLNQLLARISRHDPFTPQPLAA